jgi:CheY-like chemotaxis protein
MSAKGLRIFLVEDEAMIRMMVVDMIEELGHVVAAEAGQIGQALELAQSADFDLAILDVVAELIKSRNLPLIFATGYGAAGLPEEFEDYPALQKPFQLEALAASIEEALHPRAS